METPNKEYQQSKVYCSLCPVGMLLLGMLAFIVFFLVVDAIIFAFITFSNHNTALGIISLLIGAVIAVIFVVGATQHLRKRKERYTELHQISLNTYLQLDEEVKQTPKRYGCLYVLKDFIYSPECQFLIPFENYREISMTKTPVRYKFVPLGYDMIVEFTTEQDQKYKVRIAIPYQKDFEEKYADFIKELYAHKLHQQKGI
ncbi:MAG: hypothetical protein V3G42_07975 [Oscillospiraceae bacterium]